MGRKPCLKDVSDEERALAALYLALTSEDTPQREYSLREMFNGLRPTSSEAFICIGMIRLMLRRLA